MKGTNYIIAVIVIACLIFWRKSIVKKRKKTQKSIDTSSKAKNNFKKEELHKMSEAKSSLSLIHISEPTRLIIRSRMPSSA